MLCGWIIEPIVLAQMGTHHSSLKPYEVLLAAFSQIPILHYLVAFVLISLIFLYNFFGFHFFEDLLGGGTPIGFTYHPSSLLYKAVVSKCEVLQSRYWGTPWVSSPHLMTCLLPILGKAPDFSYKRQLFRTSDGGTFALDWLLSPDVPAGDGSFTTNQIAKDDKTRILIVIPGLSSDSNADYVKQLVFKMAQSGWNVVVINYRGMGGVPITSEVFYHGGWTEDVRAVVNHLHHEYPKIPLFIVGTSLGANVLVKYLGEEGENTPIAGAVAVCNPWDLLEGDRFFGRTLMGKFYDRVLSSGLKRYAAKQKAYFKRVGNWEGIVEARRIRDFNKHSVCPASKFETVDTYYRHSNSAAYVGNVYVPLLCINALDDPVCTKDAIAWDECRANPNVVLATTQHGGHLGFFEGLTARSMWWIRAVDEFLDVLHSTPCIHVQKKQACEEAPFQLDVEKDEKLAAAAADHDMEEKSKLMVNEDTQKKTCDEGQEESESPCTIDGNLQDAKSPINAAAATVKRCFNQISRQNRGSIWFLAFIALATSWPLLGSALKFIMLRRKRRCV